MVISRESVSSQDRNRTKVPEHPFCRFSSMVDGYGSSTTTSPPGSAPLRLMLRKGAWHRFAELTRRGSTNSWSTTSSLRAGCGSSTTEMVPDTALQTCGGDLIPENLVVRQTTSSFGVPPIRARSDQVALQRRIGVKVSGFSKSGVGGSVRVRFDPAPGVCHGWRFLPLSRKPDSFSPGLLARPGALAPRRPSVARAAWLLMGRLKGCYHAARAPAASF